MVQFQDILDGKEKLSVVGLGYVGLPLAVAFAEKIKVVGFDLNSTKVQLCKQGIDPTREIGDTFVKNTNVEFTSDTACLRDARFHIVAVPTPVRSDKTPDLSLVEEASCLIGRNLMKGSVVVYESTVYPGVTEEVCVPILERHSNLKCGVDFKVGYSPERINPGDMLHRLQTIVKVVSGIDRETLDLLAKVYELVVEAGVYRASSIKVAEAAKVIENSQRDINIAFMNELSLIFHRMGLDTLEVLQAAGTKWNFLGFRPGLVGGHCIGVDPYYLTYAAEKFGYHSQIILSGRRVNDDMGKYVAESAIKQMIKINKDICKCKVALLGITFKEDCADIRNSRVMDIVEGLGEYGIVPVISDPLADTEEAMKYYGITLIDINEINNVDCLIVAVGHREFKQLDISNILKNNGILMDIKGCMEQCIGNYQYWRL